MLLAPCFLCFNFVCREIFLLYEYGAYVVILFVRAGVSGCWALPPPPWLSFGHTECAERDLDVLQPCALHLAVFRILFLCGQGRCRLEIFFAVLLDKGMTNCIYCCDRLAKCVYFFTEPLPFCLRISLKLVAYTIILGTSKLMCRHCIFVCCEVNFIVICVITQRYASCTCFNFSLGVCIFVFLYYTGFFILLTVIISAFNIIPSGKKLISSKSRAGGHKKVGTKFIKRGKIYWGLTIYKSISKGGLKINKI